MGKNKMMKWGITTLIGHRRGLAEFCQEVKKLGYEYIELNCVKNYFAHYNALQLANSPREIEFIQEILQTNNLGCSAVDCHGFYGRSEAEFEYTSDYLLAGLEVTEKLGSKFMVTSIPACDIIPWEKMVKRMSEICRKAQDKNLEIVIEAEYNFPVGTPDSLEKFLSDVNEPNLKVNFDPSHFVRANFDVKEVIRRFFHVISHVHVKEYLPEKIHPTWYEGELNSPCSQMLDELYRFDYQGVASAETLVEMAYRGNEAPEIIMNGLKKWQKSKGIV
ncbi:MAG: sugar phosphate isomerase/epimerase [Lentisphaeria bacterium]|nr:sugar phosphate isomerase/epimerase [Lentisphaeria bacterium]